MTGKVLFSLRLQWLLPGLEYLSGVGISWRFGHFLKNSCKGWVGISGGVLNVCLNTYKPGEKADLKS